jgi:hypothetical protein
VVSASEGGRLHEGRSAQGVLVTNDLLCCRGLCLEILLHYKS